LPRVVSGPFCGCDGLACCRAYLGGGGGRTGVPQPDGAVGAAGSESLAAWAEGDCVDVAGWAGQFGGERGVGGVSDVPQPDRVVSGSFSELVSVRAEGDGVDVTPGTGERPPDGCAPEWVGDVPQPDRLVGTVACQEHGTTLRGFLPRAWDHLVASDGTTRRVGLGVLITSGTGCLKSIDLGVRDGVPGGGCD
jgi:hypothetical protein